jgi:hypothetical protein
LFTFQHQVSCFSRVQPQCEKIYSGAAVSGVTESLFKECLSLEDAREYFNDSKEPNVARQMSSFSSECLITSYPEYSRLDPFFGKRNSSMSVTFHSKRTINDLEEAPSLRMSSLSADETDRQGKVILVTFVKSFFFLVTQPYNFIPEETLCNTLDSR